MLPDFSVDYTPAQASSDHLANGSLLRRAVDVIELREKHFAMTARAGLHTCHHPLCNVTRSVTADAQSVTRTVMFASHFP
jgi:hypothetical protein